MKHLLLLSLVFFAAGSALASETARVFFPGHVAGGELKLFPPGGAIVFTGNSWSSFNPGPTTLPLEWRDMKRDDRMVRAYWTFDMPPGRFVIAAKRKNEAIVFSVRTRWTKRIVRKSEAFPIERFEKTDPVFRPMTDEEIRRGDAENMPNQSLEPTSMLGTSAAEPPRVPSTLVAHQ